MSVTDARVKELVNYINSSVLALRPEISRSELTAHLFGRGFSSDLVAAAILRSQWGRTTRLGPRPIPDLTLGQYDFTDRCERATVVIEGYAHQLVQRGTLVGVGGLLAGLLVPGSGVAAVAAALAMQSESLLPMVAELSRVFRTRYTHSSDGAFAAGGLGQAQRKLTDAVDAKFLRQVALDLAADISAGIAASFVPLLGGWVAAGLNVMTAATLPWRVGATVALYYYNGGRWLDSRDETYRRARALTAIFSTRVAGRVDLTALRSDPDVFEYQVSQTVEYLRGLLDLPNPPTGSELRRSLHTRGFPDAVAEAAIVQVFGTPSGTPLAIAAVDYTRQVGEAIEFVGLLMEFNKGIKKDELREILLQANYHSEAVELVVASLERHFKKSDTHNQEDYDVVKSKDTVYISIGERRPHDVPNDLDDIDRKVDLTHVERERQRRQSGSGNEKITTGELATSLPDVMSNHMRTVSLVQAVLDNIARRKAESPEKSKEIARIVNSLISCTGIQLTYNKQTVDLRWSKGIFEARDSSRGRVRVYSGAVFPQLTAEIATDLILMATSEEATRTLPATSEVINRKA